MPKGAQQAHCQDTSPGGARVWHDRVNGRQAHSHHWPSTSQLCDDDDGCLLQLKAAGVLTESGDQGLLKPEVRPVRPNQGYQEAKAGRKKAQTAKTNRKTPSKTALNQQRMEAFTENSGYSRRPTVKPTWLSGRRKPSRS